MKQLLTIVFLSILSVGIGYLLREKTHEFEVTTASLQTPADREIHEPKKISVEMSDIQSVSDIQNIQNEIPPAPKKPTLTLSAKSLKQGDTLVVSIEHEEKVELQIQKQKIPLISITPKKSVGIYGVDVRKEPGTLSISLLQNDTVIQEESINIEKRNFPITELVLSDVQKETGVTPQKAAEEIVQNDNAKLHEVLDKPLPDIYVKNKFAYPLPNQIVVGGFGNIRKSGSTEIRHLGVDLDAKRGDPVQTIQDGIVRLTRNLSNYGNTIVIDHGADIFSMYLHLNSIEVKEGEVVSKGQVIGTVGNTGDYSLDPHLHLSIKANGASIDPLRFIETIEKTLEK